MSSLLALLRTRFWNKHWKFGRMHLLRMDGEFHQSPATTQSRKRMIDNSIRFVLASLHLKKTANLQTTFDVATRVTFVYGSLQEPTFLVLQENPTEKNGKTGTGLQNCSKATVSKASKVGVFFMMRNPPSNAIKGPHSLVDFFPKLH